ncbi:hypothetical protein [Clostridium beijerinckii]|uniref:hypothetical protein n=1 Tax=Clostridium beijerinckii TaxID=1520 RepID=UPI002430813D|nr:hypothetical protein [Clostridium beijerinckii]MDG5852745.1 hypothetical protein [Clostridium beijerinckii]
MGNVKEYIKRHKALHIFILCLVILCIITTMCINYSYAKDDFNYYTDYEKTSEYPWFVYGEGGDLKVSGEHRIDLTWTDKSNKIYLQMLDGDGGILPSKKYLDLAKIPEGTSKIQFDCTLYFKPGQKITAYIFQFNDSKKIENATKIDNISTDTLYENDSNLRNKAYSFSTKVNNKAKYYKILFDIRGEGKAGSLTLRDMDVIFK